MQPVKKPAWQQATALVSLSTCGAMTGFAFAHATAADMTSPASVPARLTALNIAAGPGPAGDRALRSAIVSVAQNYLRMARHRTPAEMEALIWQGDSTDGADHGESCAAFASLTLELGAQAAGQRSWASGGGSYPWPLHQWADVRVETNPGSPDVVSMLQDAQAHRRWHPLGDGYRPQPGDWVLFDGHVEVVTRDAGTALYTVGGDSLPGLTVNAHMFPAPLAAQGVLGFVDNGELASTAGPGSPPATGGARAAGETAQVPGLAGGAAQTASGTGQQGQGRAAIPATPAAEPSRAPASGGSASRDQAAAGQGPAYRRHSPPPPAALGTAAQQAFISEVAPGAIAAQHRYGVPAAVTIAQAIDESSWGQSELATADRNLFGIKGTGPAGTDMQPTREYQDGTWVTRTAPFRIYHDIAESIADHGQLLATSPAYQHAMADRRVPDAFAADLTGVYATDPDYGSGLITLMKQHNLYRYDAPAPAPAPAAAPQMAGQLAAVPGLPSPAAPVPAARTAAAPGGRAPVLGVPGGLSVPGLQAACAAASAGNAQDSSRARARTRRARTPAGMPVTASAPGRPGVPAGSTAAGGHRAGQRPGARTAPRDARPVSRPYLPQIPRAITAAFTKTALTPLTQAQDLYQDVSGRAGISWELLAACDWMQCHAQPRYSPVHGEKLGTANPDGTVYRTRSAALAQCASDLIALAEAVYQIELTAPRALTVRELAMVFAAFRWGGLLETHGISAMEFPYSVAGLTPQHLKMRWPDIDDPRAPDKPGTRFHMPHGAVPIVLSLGFQAIT
jgi:flagellum-specific peptidoglycan hydrolase FlgJ